MQKASIPITLSVVLGVCFIGFWPAESQAWPFGPKGGDADEKKANICQQRDEMLAQSVAINPEIKDRISEAAGDATFKQVNVNLLLLATANGYGMVVDNKAKKDTFMRGAQFLQVENQMALFVDLEIASEMPQIAPVTPPGSAK